MRFACQSCGKAYNLPEERIADKSNVKLKCRVCGAIVEVKRQGELVAQLLDEADANRIARVSEAPVPLTSINPEDDDDGDGATVSISESSIHEGGPLHLEMPILPAAAATGFAAAALPPLLARSEGGGARLEGAGVAPLANLAPPLPPPPLSPSSLPPPPPLRGMEALADAGADGTAINGSNGSSAHFLDEAGPDPEADAAEELLAPVAAAAGPTGLAATASELAGDLPDLPAAPGETPQRDNLFKLKMAAAFVTGVLIDRIISGLFQ